MLQNNFEHCSYSETIKVFETNDFLVSFIHYLKSKYKYCILLDSCSKKSWANGLSVLAFEPSERLYGKSSKWFYEKNNQVSVSTSNPFDLIEEFIQKTPNHNYNVPFSNGIVAGYLGYELGRYLETLPETTKNDLDLPELWLCKYTKLLVFDYNEKKLTIISNNKNDLIILKTEINNYINQLLDSKKTKSKAESIIKKSVFLNNSNNNIFRDRNYDNDKLSSCSTFRYQDYINSVNKVINYINNGDIYQANISQRFHKKVLENPVKLYKKIRDYNKVLYGAYIDCGSFKILSNSPELFLKYCAKTGEIITKPIKGTKPRGSSSEEDKQFIEDLKNSNKDKAEHLMIVDLLRNDLGRTSQIGTVKVTDFEKVETYKNLHHLVSTVKGTILESKNSVDCLKAAFPGGSITGAPKIRSMEIIDEIEQTSRGIYTGSIGYFDLGNGDMELNIAIRTAVVKNKEMYIYAGGGIVHDSKPESEYKETITKALAFLNVLENKT